MRFQALSATTALMLTAALFSFLSRPGTVQSITGAHQLRAQGDHFELDGKPFQIISGAIHYARVPRAYWRDRLQKARAMGLNTVETYVFWNLHETSPGIFDFSGDKDIAEFIREAQEEGLYVLLRPGPYVCAEWEFGGYPAWLLHDEHMVVRSQDPPFLAAATRWFHRLGKELAPLQSGKGGPILAVQVENEYGSYGSDHAYMERIHHLLIESGFDQAMLYTADGAAELASGSLPELPAVINFGTGSAKEDFALFDKSRPHAPRMCGEYWAGWFDHWGAKHERTDGSKEAEELRWMLHQGISVNLYMFHGGTSFGWMNGANSNGKNYEPDTTSYDYDAPVSEDGTLSKKYFLFRDVIREATGQTLPDPPAPRSVHALAAIALNEATSLWDHLPKPIESERPLPMEEIGQNYGFILYRTQLESAYRGQLSIGALHGFAQIFLDGTLVGKLDRRLNESSLAIGAKGPARLDILVENTGRVNFGHELPNERAGITKRVMLGSKELKNWSIYPLPMEGVSDLSYSSKQCSGDCFYRARFEVEEPADVFVDTQFLTKGMVWINGRPLGRFWDIGPQRTLYLPAPWLRKGSNEMVVFDHDGKTGRTVQLTAKPMLDKGTQVSK